MEQNQENKFVCKYCNKGYPCGKSLGGHIRTHMNNENCAGVSTTNPPYDLRGNPKKSKRFSDESGNGTLLREMICKECGKGFQSLKALCGHMACHSEKERVFVFQTFEDHWDSQSDTETSAAPTPSRRRRSKRIRCKTSNNSVSITNGSSSVSEIAMCLMMLSRDCKKGMNSVADSSDNNSVILEEQRETKLKSGSGAKDLRKFKCPFCFKVFKSGQALGGHKRSHFVGGSEDTTLVIKQDSPEMPLPALIDLNLPAPVEEDAVYSV
ncbi:hypothetical protein GQ457_10G028810 [Hibiscus cannabinus]